MIIWGWNDISHAVFWKNMLKTGRNKKIKVLFNHGFNLQEWGGGTTNDVMSPSPLLKKYGVGDMSLPVEAWVIVTRSSFSVVVTNNNNNKNNNNNNKY